MRFVTRTAGRDQERAHNRRTMLSPAGSGAPQGNRNALKRGRYTAELRAFRRALRALMREADEALELTDGISKRE